MASSSSPSCGLALACFVLLASSAAATQYKVGGDNGWAVPSATAVSFNTWAEKTTFQIGDELLFVYPKDKDSVLLVEPADYNACNVSSFDKRFADGSTKVALDRAGAFFFISGVEASCRANEKLIVMVTAAAASAPAPAGSGGGSSPSPSAPAPSSGGGAPVTPSSPKAPAAGGKNSTAAAAKGGAAPPAAGGGGDRNGGAPGAGIAAAAGFVASVAGCVAYATLAF